MGGRFGVERGVVFISEGGGRIGLCGGVVLEVVIVFFGKDSELLRVVVGDCSECVW